jgi:hypothetical protein
MISNSNRSSPTAAATTTSPFLTKSFCACVLFSLLCASDEECGATIEREPNSKSKP